MTRRALASRRLPAVVPVLAAGLLLAAAPKPLSGRPGGPAGLPQGRTVLKNGLTVLVVERRSIPLVQIQLMIKSGSASDPAGKEGTAALTARLMKRGTKSRPAAQFFEEVEFVGGTIDTAVDPDATFVRAEFASKDMEVAFNLVADLVLNPAFRPEELDKEKRLQVADIVGRQDDPEDVAGQAFDSWLYGEHPYGRPVDGWRRSVEGIGRDTVTGFYESRYALNDAVLAVVGDVDAAQSVQRAERYFSAWKRRTVPESRVPEAAPVHGRKILLVDKPDATQSQIRLGNAGIRHADPDYVPFVVGNTVLGGAFTSWLVDEVRVKRGLTYAIDSRVEARRSAGSFYVATSTRNAGVLETIQVTLDQIRRLRGGELPEADLDKARGYLAGIYPLHIESPDRLAAEILRDDLDGLEADAINQYPKKVRAAGADAVKRVAARRLPLDDLAIVVVGPAQTLKKDLESLGPVTVRTVAAALDPGAAAAPVRP